MELDIPRRSYQRQLPNSNMAKLEAISEGWRSEAKGVDGGLGASLRPIMFISIITSVCRFELNWKWGHLTYTPFTAFEIFISCAAYGGTKSIEFLFASLLEQSLPS
jgi:hypothetical protein